MCRMNQALLSSKNMCWCTPQDFFDKLDSEFNFVLDPAATNKTAKCALFYTPETDGLSQSWDRGGAVFCNPPYGREIGKWVRKAFEEARCGYPIILLTVTLGAESKSYTVTVIFERSISQQLWDAVAENSDVADHQTSYGHKFN